MFKTVMRRRLAPVLVGALALAALSHRVLSGATPRFFEDDPLRSFADTQDASGVKPWDIDLAYDLLLNLFGKPGDKTPEVRAKNVNTVDEVPDTSWFTNRLGTLPLTPQDVAKGPDTSNGPAPGQWTVTAGKSDGITPGFTIRDSAGQLWFLKFDPPGYRGMATGTEVAVTKFFWALGYHVPENHIAALRVDNLVLSDTAKITPPGREARQMRREDIDFLLKRADRQPDGSFRIVASKGLEGKPIGGFKFYGTRPDDPNDVIPHEHMRELRGYGVFAAWLNHVDAKAINSLDTVVTANGRTFVRHHLLDFGSTLGSAAVGPREEWEGYEYLFEGGKTAKGMASFGFYIPSWRRIPFYESPSIGRIPSDNTTFNPERWKPRVPNQAFRRARIDDKFWAARKLRALTDDMIRAAVASAQFGDPPSEEFLVKALIERRDSIVLAYLPAINPIVDLRLDDSGMLTFRNAAVDAGVAKPSSYRATWGSFDNATDQATRIGETTGTDARLQAPQGLPTSAGAYIKLEVSAVGGPNPSWEKPIDVYFRRVASGWKLVGLERLPDGSKRATTTE